MTSTRQLEISINKDKGENLYQVKDEMTTTKPVDVSVSVKVKYVKERKLEILSQAVFWNYKASADQQGSSAVSEALEDELVHLRRTVR